MRNKKLHDSLICIASVLMILAAALTLRPHIKETLGWDNFGFGNWPSKTDDAAKPDEPAAPAKEIRSAQNSRKSGKTLAERNKDKFNVGEMRREAEDMLQRFRGTPEERQSVIEECEDGKAFLLAIADDSIAAFDDKSPDELRKAREDFEKDYRAQLDYLQTGKLQRMLKTPEEQEVIGSTIEVVQQFLERIDEALQAAGY